MANIIDEEKSMAVINALSAEYENVFLIDLEDGTYRILKAMTLSGNALDEKQKQSFDYGEVCESFISAYVHPEDREAFAQAISLEHLRLIFRVQGELTGSFRILTDGETHYYRYTYYNLANINSVLAGFCNIDDVIARHADEKKRQYEKELAYKARLEEQLLIVNTLTRSFKNVYLVDFEKETVRVLKLGEGYKDILQIEQDEFPFEYVLSHWLNTVVCPADRERVGKVFETENVRKAFAEKNELIGNYRSIVDGKVYHYQYFLSKVDEAGTKAVLGFQNVDEVVAEHVAREKEKRALEEAHLKGEREHAEVLAALSTIYSTIFRADVETHNYEILTSIPLMKDTAARTGNFDDVKEKIISVFMAPEMRDKMREFLDLNTLADRLKNVNTISAEYMTPDGRWLQSRFVVKRRDENGAVKEILYVARDNNAEKQREFDQQEQLRTQLGIINSLANEYKTLYLIDCETGGWRVFKASSETNITSVVKDISVYNDYDEMVSVYAERYVAEDDRANFVKHMKVEALLRETPDTGVNAIFFDRVYETGAEHCQTNAAKFTTDSGKSYIVIGFRNIHEAVEKQVRQQEQLAHALAAAQQASKAKSTFLNSMSHDIRTPMNAIIGFTALAQTHINDKEQVQDYLAKISTSSTHLLSLINDILDMSRIESGTVKLEEKPVHIPDLLHDLRTMILGLVNAKNLNLYIDTQDVLHEDVITDKLRLNQVLINIVGNAIKFTQPGGDIIIRLLEKPCSMRDYATYEFSVKDNGVGMSKDFLEHIFESFTREHSATVTGIQGSGLGMAITKNIVDMMGGEITAESEEGKGSLFTVTLSLRHADAPVRTEPIPALLGARALVVDDNLDTCRSVSKMLRDIRMRPDWTVSGREAIIRAQDAAEMKDEYKVYIIDYLMPDMNGLETVRQIRRFISEEVPIIVLTAYDWADFEDEARAAGVTAFVSKPIFMSELRRVLTHQEGEESIAKEAARHYDYSGRRVLLVEDNELNREIATAILEEAGLEVDTAADGTEAVDIMYKADEDRYDLIFMDIQMPKMDGYTATHEIRTFDNNRKANIPIVAMTANAFDEDRKKSIEAGMNAHIAKPISIDDIAKVLDTIFVGEK